MPSFQSPSFGGDSAPPWPPTSADVVAGAAGPASSIGAASDLDFMAAQHAYADADNAQSGMAPPSPERPPVSPITPVATIAQLARLDGPSQMQGSSHGQRVLPPPVNTNIPPAGVDTRFLARPPPPVPIAASEEPDVIALRSAISILQMQRDRARRDIRTLEEIKTRANDDPEGFVTAYRERRRHQPVQQSVTDYLGPTIAKDDRDLTDLALPAYPDSEDGHENDEDDEDEDDDEDSDSRSPHAGAGTGAGTKTRKDSARRSQDSSSATPPPASSDSSRGGSGGANSSFPIMPGAQNIVRCPAINWNKYHVVGESLDKIHYDQLRRPNLGDGAQDPRFPDRPPEFRLAAPYSEDRDRAGFGGAGARLLVRLDRAIIRWRLGRETSGFRMGVKGGRDRSMGLVF